MTSGQCSSSPPGPLTAAGAGFLSALQAAAPTCVELTESSGSPDVRLLLAPDPSSEAREVVRDVVGALDRELSLSEIAVFHGADRGYPRLLREQFESAGVPSVPLPGVPLSDKPVGRGALMLASLPALDYSRVAVMDFMHVAPLKYELPAEGGLVRPASAYWDKLSREAGIVRGAANWTRRLDAAVADIDRSIANHQVAQDTVRVGALEANKEGLLGLAGWIAVLARRLDPLRTDQPAQSFIDTFCDILDDYLDDRAEGFDDLTHEVEQLGTVGAVGGSFSLSTFVEALRANLEAKYVRPAKFGEGVIVADYRQAAALQFKHVSLCGAYEGALPAGPGPDSLVDDRSWAALRVHHPYIEDVRLRLERSEQGVARAIASAGTGRLVWSSPVSESGGTRDRYPSPHMVAAARGLDPALATASNLRTAASREGILRRGTSPMALYLRGATVDQSEAAVRQAISLWRAGDGAEGHRAWRAVGMLRARRSPRFTEFDGNLSGLQGAQLLELQRVLSPTSLERYATCGFQYFCGSLLRIKEIEEPAERQMMDAAERGTLIHSVLERFFRQQMAAGRPALNEAWNDADRVQMLAIVDDELSQARERGLTGLDVYAEHEARTIRADLVRFLEEDTALRREYGTIPVGLEQDIPETEIGAVRLRGRVDRIDQSPDGRVAIVIDYKSGSAWGSDKVGGAEDPFVSGTKLQLPTYLAAARDADTKIALYWYITHKGGFETAHYVPNAELDDRYRRTVEAIAGGIRVGSFPAVPGEEDEWRGSFDNCRYCDFTRICSRRRDFEFAAKHSEDGAQPWVAVAGTAKGETPPMTQPVDFRAADEEVRRSITERLDQTLFVEAGAGTGKTRALVDRVVAHVLAGVPVDRIIAITFTEKAAAELRERVRRGLEEHPVERAEQQGLIDEALKSLDRARISTIHSFAQSLLYAYAAEAGVDPSFRVHDEVLAARRLQEQWRLYLEHLADEPEALRVFDRVLSLGLGTREIEQLAMTLVDKGELIAVLDAYPIVVPAPFWPDLGGLLAELEALPLHLPDLNDVLLQRVIQVLNAVRTVESADDRVSALNVSAALEKLKWGVSNQAAWGGGGDNIARVRDVAARAQEALVGLLSSVRAEALAQLMPYVVRFARDDALARGRDGLMTFDDLILLVRNLLRDHPGAVASLRENYDLLMIDEFQDTDPLQVDIARSFATDPNTGFIDPGRLFLVGDPKQSIYRFRRADMAIYSVTRTEIEAQGGMREVLALNRRSRTPIVDWVNAVFAPLIGPGSQPEVQPAYEPIHPDRQIELRGPGVAVYGETMNGPNAREVRQLDAQAVAGLCQLALEEGWEVMDRETQEVQPLRYRDIAILIPTRSILVPLERSLADSGVPYRIEGGSLVYRTQEIRDLVNFLTAIDDPYDEIAVVATLRSAAFACSDLELAQFRGDNRSFNYLSGALDGQEGRVAAGLKALRRVPH